VTNDVYIRRTTGDHTAALMTLLPAWAALLPSDGDLRLMMNGHSFLDWFFYTGTASLAIAWIVCALWIVVYGPVLARRHRDDALVLAGVTALALAVRLAIPWGPLDFAEASRLESAWNVRIEPLGNFIAMPFLFGVGRLFEVHPLTLARFLGPVLSAIGVGLVYALGRVAGLGRSAALVGAAILLIFPAHLRYSASGVLTTTGATLWLAVFAVAAARGIPTHWKVPFMTAAIVIGVFARPEYRLLCLALVPLVFTPGWTWRSRIALGVVTGVALLEYTRHLGVGHEHAKMERMWGTFYGWLLRDPAMNPTWWLLAGVAGLAIGKGDVRVRVATGLSAVILLGTYFVMGLEYNPYWGEWRYAVAAVPFLTVGASGLAEKLLARPGRERYLLAAAPVALLSGLLHYRAATRAVDVQVEFHYVRELAPRIAEGFRDVVVIMNDGQEAARSIPTESTTAYALALATQPPYNSPYSCKSHKMGRPRVRLWSQNALAEGCIDGFDPAKTAVYIGLYQPRELVELVTRKYDLVPIDERAASAAPATQHMNTQCVYRDGDLLGSSIPDCELKLGFYRLAPKGAPPP
jgi:hypothetical protein